MRKLYSLYKNKDSLQRLHKGERTLFDLFHTTKETYYIYKSTNNILYEFTYSAGYKVYLLYQVDLHVLWQQ